MALRINALCYNNLCLDMNCHSCEKKTGPIRLALVGLTAGWQTKCGLKLKSLLFGFLLRLISVQCYYTVRNAFQSAFLKYSLFQGVF